MDYELDNSLAFYKHQMAFIATDLRVFRSSSPFQPPTRLTTVSVERVIITTTKYVAGRHAVWQICHAMRHGERNEETISLLQLCPKCPDAPR